jgi:MFS family permease
MNHPESNNKINQKRRFILTFIGTIIYFIGIMTPFGIGQYSVYITSYFHHFNPKINIQLGNLMMPILTLALSLSSPLGGILEHKLGMHLTLIIGSVILELLIFIFITQTNIYITFLLIILIGMTIGSVITIPGKNICFYYPKKRGMIISLITSCNVIVGSFVNVLGEKIINPEKVTLKKNETYYSLNIAKNYIKFYKISLIVIPICSLISLPFLKKYEQSNDNQNEKLDKNININELIEKENYSKNLKSVICNSRIWKIAFISIFSQFGMGFALSTFRVYGALISFNGTLMQYAPLFFGTSMIVFGPIWGYINDKLQSFKIVRIICLFFIFDTLMLSIFIKNNIIYIICIFIGSIFSTGINSVMRPYIMKIYGMKYFIEIGGVITICTGIINISKGFLSFLISFHFHTGKELQFPYRIIFIIGIGLNALAYILALKEKEEEFIYPYGHNKINSEDFSNNLGNKVEVSSLENNDVIINNNKK